MRVGWLINSRNLYDINVRSVIFVFLWIFIYFYYGPIITYTGTDVNYFLSAQRHRNNIRIKKILRYPKTSLLLKALLFFLLNTWLAKVVTFTWYLFFKFDSQRSSSRAWCINYSMKILTFFSFIHMIILLKYFSCHSIRQKEISNVMIWSH